MSPAELSLSAAAAAISAHDLSPVELTEAVLARIEEIQPRLNAYVTVLADRARADAAEAEREITNGRYRGPLHGIPLALKDIIDTAGIATTASSRVHEQRIPERDSAVAARLAAAGAVLLGKTHTHEFAYGLTTPQTRHAWADDRVAGGSSGGSAVAVATGAAVFALGTDTGGSIRVPAALNGVVGFKPTYDAVSRDGVWPLSWSLDHVGPITRTVDDAALVFEALSGIPAIPDRRELRGLRIGVPRNYFFDRLDPVVAQSIERSIAEMAALGARPTPVDIPLAEYIKPAQWAVMVAEATSVHQRDIRRAPELYTPEVRLLLEAGEFLSAGDYLRGQRARALMRQEWARLFADVDVIVAPTVPATAAFRDQAEFTWPDGSVESVADAYVRLCSPANLTGAPALSLPMGMDEHGLPTGLQLIGRPRGDRDVLDIGRLCEPLSTFKRPTW